MAKMPLAEYDNMVRGLPVDRTCGAVPARRKHVTVVTVEV
jgi:hypothetical protein